MIAFRTPWVRRAPITSMMTTNMGQPNINEANKIWSCAAAQVNFRLLSPKKENSSNSWSFAGPLSVR